MNVTDISYSQHQYRTAPFVLCSVQCTTKQRYQYLEILWWCHSLRNLQQNVSNGELLSCLLRLVLTWVLPIHLWLFLCLLEISDSSRHLHWQVDSSILKLHGLLVLLHSLRRKEIKLCFFWFHDRSLPVSWDFGQWAIDEMRFCWSSSHFFHGLDWHFCQWWSLPLYFGKLVQNTFCKLPKCGWQGYQGLKQCTAIDDVCDMSLVWLDNMMTVILQSMHH